MRLVTVAELQRDAPALLREVGETGSVIVMDEGRPAAVLLRLSEDDLEDYLLARNEGLARELEQAYEECLHGAGRPAQKLLDELSR